MMKKITIPLAILFLMVVCFSSCVMVFAEAEGNSGANEGGLPVGVIFCLVAGVAILAGGVSALVMAKKKK